MSFENSPVPLSIFAEDGIMLSGKKSDFMHKLEELVSEEIAAVDTANCIIYDGHGIIWTLPAPNEVGEKASYRDMGRIFMNYIISKANSTSSDITGIHIVFDKYNPLSIMNQEWEKSASNQIRYVLLDLPAPP